MSEQSKKGQVEPVRSSYKNDATTSLILLINILKVDQIKYFGLALIQTL